MYLGLLARVYKKLCSKRETHNRAFMQKTDEILATSLRTLFFNRSNFPNFPFCIFCSELIIFSKNFLNPVDY